jgi:hemerythrin-like metal-binding protein
MRHDTLDREHGIQVGLIDALEEAVNADRSSERIDLILEQLIEYSKVHFLSEQLLMRLHAYPAYEDHQRDHDQLLAALEALRRPGTFAAAGEAAAAVDSIRGLLVTHIAGRDEDLAEYLARPAPGATPASKANRGPA